MALLDTWTNKRMIEEILELSGTEAEKAYLLKIYATVGELMLTTSLLERQVNYVCIAVLILGEAVMIEPVMASVDGARKLEILKAYAAKITAPRWRKALVDYVKDVEMVNRIRNVAAHGILQLEDDKAVFMMPSAARLLKAINLRDRKADKTSISSLENAIEKARLCINNGGRILENLEKVSAARLKAATMTDTPKPD